jgi:hypothetical protein
MKFVGVSEILTLFYKATPYMSSKPKVLFSPYIRTQIPPRRIRAFVRTGNNKGGKWIIYRCNERLGPKEMGDAVFTAYDKLQH